MRSALTIAIDQIEFNLLDATENFFKKRYDTKINTVAAMMDGFIAYKLNTEIFE